MTESRRQVLARFPDYAVDINPTDQTVTVSFNGSVIVESNAALCIQETRHAEAYYIPRDDIDMTQLIKTELSTYCPFKGHASYWSVPDEPELENFVWSYEDPYPEVKALKNYMSFYTNKVKLDTT